MAANFAWGIDVGNRALKAIKLVRDGDGVRIDDFEVIEHETVLSQAGDNREALIQSALSNLVARHAFKGGTVGVGVSGQSNPRRSPRSSASKPFSRSPSRSTTSSGATSSSRARPPPTSRSASSPCAKSW